ncbi:MobC family plasmid mobilization relaxosome protein [Criibacterium bergeronii]|uniref:MobC family plasmid mobilization relaxosome protein n=1 Tax=Criibacterium bergeronii TaxID=1871336 RepID=A0A552VCH9_9FIRM|nr:plasmid mobilization relaxosome protein MobC [Criibacterium bergeronii]TRW28185.1 MobC family plasmid mobilization relaxosome protein [Criibacterium bergeronii]
MSEENRTRCKKITVRLTDDEREVIYDRYKQSGERTISNFFYKMILKGYIVKLDLSEILEITSSINKVGTNINQIVKNANMVAHISDNKVDELIRLLKEINEKQDRIVSAIYPND